MSLKKKVKLNKEYFETLFDSEQSLFELGKEYFLIQEYENAIYCLECRKLLKEGDLEADFILAVSLLIKGEKARAEEMLSSIYGTDSNRFLGFVENYNILYKNRSIFTESESLKVFLLKNIEFKIPNKKSKIEHVKEKKEKNS
jgi:hypothetical protein